MDKIRKALPLLRTLITARPPLVDRYCVNRHVPFQSKDRGADDGFDGSGGEKGITIRSKNGRSMGGYRINIVDTPGHADFGGESRAES